MYRTIGDVKFWDGWIKDNSKAPHEAISEAITSAEEMLVSLRKLRPKSLREVSEEIDAQVAIALRSFVKDAGFQAKSKPGIISIGLDGRNMEMQIDIMDVARDIASWDQDHTVRGVDIDAIKTAWAMKLEKAASLIRKTKI